MGALISVFSLRERKKFSAVAICPDIAIDRSKWKPNDLVTMRATVTSPSGRRLG
jgi:hypothetical protein